MELLREPPRCPGPEADEPASGNYFVAAYPPFSRWSAEAAPAARRQLDAPRATDAPFILYVHVPFCARRCDYCYYLSYADRTRPQMAEYLDALRRELALYRDSLAFTGRRPSCVYVGGGTPSLLPADDIARLLGGWEKRSRGRPSKRRRSSVPRGVRPGPSCESSATRA